MEVLFVGQIGLRGDNSAAEFGHTLGERVNCGLAPVVVQLEYGELLQAQRLDSEIGQRRGSLILRYRIAPGVIAARLRKVGVRVGEAKLYESAALVDLRGCHRRGAAEVA